MNELVIKIVGERIKVGVLFPERLIAEKAYDAFEKESIKKYYTAVIEIHGDFVNLTLSSNRAKIEYQNLKYKHEELMKLRILMRPNAEILFAHIFKNPSRGLIAIPANCREFIKINYHHIVIVKKLA